MLAFNAPRPVIIIPSRMASGGMAGRWMELLQTLRWEPSSVQAGEEGCESPGSVFQPRSYIGNRCCAGLTVDFYKSISPLLGSVGKSLFFTAAAVAHSQPHLLLGAAHIQAGRETEDLNAKL